MTSAKRVRTIDLENPFVDSFEGMCEMLLVRMAIGLPRCVALIP